MNRQPAADRNDGPAVDRYRVEQMPATAQVRTKAGSSVTAARGMELAVVALFTAHSLATMFRLYTPLDLSEEGTRVITSGRMAMLAPVMVIAWSLAMGRAQRMLETPGLRILILYAMSLVVTALVFAEDESGAVQEVFRGAIFPGFVATYAIFSSVKRIKVFVHITVYLGAVIVVLSQLGILTTALLPTTFETYSYMATLRGQLASTGIAGLDMALRRGSVLWLDANNSGYLLATLALFAAYMVIGQRRTGAGFVFHLAILILFLSGVLLTLSRGAMVALAAGLVVLLPLMGLSKRSSAVLLFSLAGLVSLAFAIPGFSDSATALVARLDLAQNFISGEGTYTGQESGRQETIQLALEEFGQLPQPVFGRGPGTVGLINEAGAANHTFYLNLLVQWGALGAVLYLVAVLHLSRRLWSTITVLQKGSAERGLAVALLSVVAAGLVQGLLATVGSVWLALVLGAALRDATVGSTEAARTQSSSNQAISTSHYLGRRLAVSRARWDDRRRGDRSG